MEKAIKTLFTQAEIDRITTKLKQNGKSVVTVDVHGLTVKEARRLLLNLIAIDKEGCDVKVIHGYHHGTAIKEMIQNDLPNPRVIEKTEPLYNPGATVLTVRKVA